MDLKGWKIEDTFFSYRNTSYNANFGIDDYKHAELPELYFNAGGGTVEQVVEGGATEILDVKFNRIDIPLLVGVKLGPARLNVGPVGSFVISETTDLTELEPEFELFSSSMTWGFQAGLGLDISKISLDVRYEGSLSALGETFSVGGTDFPLDARPAQWIISVGFWFK